MKRIWISLVLLATVGAVAQKQETQSGTPALLEAINGKKARVFLQSLEDGNLTFQAYKSDRNNKVPAAKIKSLGFSLNKEELDRFRERGTISNDEISEIFGKENVVRAEKLELIFKAILGNIAGASSRGEYAEVVAAVEPLMAERAQYMGIENNLRDTFCTLMNANRKLGEYDKVRKAAHILLEADDPQMVQRGQVNLALAAIAGNDLPTAEKIRGEVASEAAGLYLQACIERAEQRPVDAIKTVSSIIIDHANDVEWLAPSELLCAYLYVDMLGTNSVITTNSALNTARQVKNMYSGTSVAGDAEKLWIDLGGAELEAAAAEEKAAQKAAEEKAEREKKEAEEKARQEAEAASRIESAVETNTNVTTEIESK